MSTIYALELFNVALVLLGQPPLQSPDQAHPHADVLRANFKQVVEAEIRKYDWNCVAARKQLPAMAEAPAFEWAYQYQMPSDCLKVRQIVGLEKEQWKVEGRRILTNQPPSLKIRYSRRVNDVAEYDPLFVQVGGAALAIVACEPITGSGTLKESVRADYRAAMEAAYLADSLEGAPDEIEFSGWLGERG